MSNHEFSVERIVSGGQTGVDRAALDAAIEVGLEHGGWCPRGRLSEDGVIDARYRLREMQSWDYADRTRQNVIDSDGTLILYLQRLSGGTALTNRIAKEVGRPLMRVRLDREVRYDRITQWLRENQICVLNIAGPRGSSHPKLEKLAFDVICHLFRGGGALPLSD